MAVMLKMEDAKGLAKLIVLCSPTTAVTYKNGTQPQVYRHE